MNTAISASVRLNKEVFIYDYEYGVQGAMWNIYAKYVLRRNNRIEASRLAVIFTYPALQVIRDDLEG